MLFVFCFNAQRPQNGESEREMKEKVIEEINKE